MIIVIKSVLSLGQSYDVPAMKNFSNSLSIEIVSIMLLALFLMYLLPHNAQLVEELVWQLNLTQPKHGLHFWCMSLGKS